MYYRSLLDLALEEDSLCEDIQMRINLLDAARQVELEGWDISKHAQLLSAAGNEAAVEMERLRAVRGELERRLWGRMGGGGK